jgi:hypothetical protein
MKPQEPESTSPELPPESDPASPGGKAPLASKPSPPTVLESQLKSRLLFLMLGVKLLVIAWLFTLWESGGFTTEQFSGTLGLLIPVFTTYIGVMIREVIEQSKTPAPKPTDEPAPDPPTRSRTFQWLAFGVLVVYGIALLLIIGLRPRGLLSYAQMNTFLTLLEAGFGIYVGRIVFSLFKEKPAT